jgi:hypothetical protein
MASRLTQNRRKFILSHLEEGRTISEVMQALSLDRGNYYRWCEEDEVFKNEANVARMAKPEAIENQLQAILEEGALETTVKRDAQGETTETSTSRKYYPSTMMRYLERRHPDYRAERIQAGGTLISLPDGNLKTEGLTDHERRQLLTLLRKCGADISRSD